MVQITVDGDIPRNWFANGGFSLRPGTAYTHEYDSLIDSPTQYGNVGNYPTFSPTERMTGYTYFSPTLLNANMQASSYGNLQIYAYSTMNATRGKWYFEGYVPSMDTTPGVPTATYISPNLAFSRYQADGIIADGTGPTAVITYGATYGAGDIIGVAFDTINMTVDWYWNGVKQGNTRNISPAANELPFRPMVSMAWALGSWYINFGQQPFAYPIPPGYKTICSANLANTPIYKGKKYFDVGISIHIGLPDFLKSSVYRLVIGRQNENDAFIIRIVFHNIRIIVCWLFLHQSNLGSFYS